MKHYYVIFAAVLLLLSTAGCGQDINRRLLAAAEEGDLLAVSALVDAGAVPNGLPDQEWTPLKTASYNGHVEVVRTLLSTGAQVDRTQDEDTPLMLAVWRGHVAVVKVLLEASAAVEAPGQFQPLHEAAAHGLASILEMLVDAGGDVNQTNGNGGTPLMAASSWNRPEITRILLAHGANVDAISNGGYTALMNAAVMNGVENLEMLLAAGADTELKTVRDWTALRWAEDVGRREAVAVLLRAGADVTALDAEMVVDRGASADLIEAAKAGDDAGIRSWLAQGADLNAADSQGRTALMWATRETHISVMEELLRAGANVDARNDLRPTALFEAVMFSRRAVDVLIAHGANVDAKDPSGGFPRGIAASSGNLEAAEALLQAGADVNAQNEDGRSALINAAFDGRVGIVELLLEQGAKVDATDVNGRTALVHAAAAGRDGLIGLLARHDAALNRADNRGMTPLMRAAENGHVDVVRTLLDLGADPDVVNPHDQTARVIALRENQMVIAEVLRTARAD